jgi:hypothetical protein
MPIGLMNNAAIDMAIVKANMRRVRESDRCETSRPFWKSKNELKKYVPATKRPRKKDP